MMNGQKSIKLFLEGWQQWMNFFFRNTHIYVETHTFIYLRLKFFWAIECSAIKLE